MTSDTDDSSVPGLSNEAWQESIEDSEELHILRNLTVTFKSRPPIPRIMTGISRNVCRGKSFISRKSSTSQTARMLQDAGKTGQLLLEENARLKQQLREAKEDAIRLQGVRDERVYEASKQKSGHEKMDKARRAFRKQKTMRLQVASGIARLPEDLDDDLQVRKALKDELQKQQIRNDMMAVHAKQEEALLKALTAEHKNQSFREKQLATLEKEFEALSREREKHFKLLMGVQSETNSLTELIKNAEEGNFIEEGDDDGVPIEELQRIADQNEKSLGQLREDIALREEEFASMKKQWQDKENALTKLMDEAESADTPDASKVNLQLAVLQDEWTKIQIEKSDFEMEASELREQTKDTIAKRGKAYDSFYIGSASRGSPIHGAHKSGGQGLSRFCSSDMSPISGGVNVYQQQAAQGFRAGNRELRLRINDIKVKKSFLSKSPDISAKEEELCKIMDEASNLKDQIRFHTIQQEDEMVKRHEKIGELSMILQGLHADANQLERDQDLYLIRLKLVDSDLRQWRINECELKEKEDERISQEFATFIDKLDQEISQWEQTRSKLWKEVLRCELRVVDQKATEATGSPKTKAKLEELTQKLQEVENEAPEMDKLHIDNIVKHKAIAEEIQDLIIEMKVAQAECFKIEQKLQWMKRERNDMSPDNKTASNAHAKEELDRELKANLVIIGKLERLKMKLRFITDETLSLDSFTNLGMIPAALVRPNIIPIGADVNKIFATHEAKYGSKIDKKTNVTVSSQIAFAREKSLSAGYMPGTPWSIGGDLPHASSTIFSPGDITEGRVIHVTSTMNPAVRWVDGSVSSISADDDYFELNRDVVLVYMPGTTLIPIDVKDLVLGMEVFGGVRMYKSGKVTGLCLADSSLEFTQTNVLVSVNWASSIFPNAPTTNEQLSTLRAVYNLADPRSPLRVLDAMIGKQVCALDNEGTLGSIMRIEASSDCVVSWENSTSTTVPACCLTPVDSELDEEVAVAHTDHLSVEQRKQQKRDAGKTDAESDMTEENLYAVWKNMVLVRLTAQNATVGMNVLTLPPSREGVGAVVSVSTEAGKIVVDVRWDLQNGISTVALDALCAPRRRVRLDRASRKEVLLSDIKNPCVHIIVTQDGKIGSVNSLAKDKSNNVEWTVRWMDGTESTANPKGAYAITYDSVPEICVPLKEKDARLGRAVYHCSWTDKGKGRLEDIESSTNYGGAKVGLLQCRVRWADGIEDPDPVPLRELRVLPENVLQIFEVSDYNSLSNVLGELHVPDERMQLLTRILKPPQDKAHGNWKLSQKVEQLEIINENLLTMLHNEQRIYDRIKFYADRAHLELETTRREMRMLMRARIVESKNA
eukprot:GEMP01001203.1.p1 GENE.GEMP01001203.1~~GEMP01001203.1.p1  ORF type:complete len:1340 (+),score=312.19 GEMP01001203.1:212-4231(+)